MSRLAKDERYFIIEVTTKEIEDILGRLNPDEEWYVGVKQHDMAEMRLEMVVNLREKMLTALRARGTALHYLVGDNKPRFRDKTLAKRFEKPNPSPASHGQEEQRK